jgi:hypothetical protein
MNARLIGIRYSRQESALNFVPSYLRTTRKELVTVEDVEDLRNDASRRSPSGLRAPWAQAFHATWKRLIDG